jgi:hypothetical protein
MHSRLKHAARNPHPPIGAAADPGLNLRVSPFVDCYNRSVQCIVSECRASNVDE